jgi:hypothetical protein
MRRREFLLKVTALCAIIALPMVRLVRQTEDTKVVRALRGKFYPGPVRPLDKENLSRSEKLAG